jgi:hypothetical protein
MITKGLDNHSDPYVFHEDMIVVFNHYVDSYSFCSFDTDTRLRHDHWYHHT